MIAFDVIRVTFVRNIHCAFPGSRYDLLPQPHGTYFVKMYSAIATFSAKRVPRVLYVHKGSLEQHLH